MDLIISIENKRTRFDDEYNINLVNSIDTHNFFIDCDPDGRKVLRIACEYKLDNVTLAILEKCSNNINLLLEKSSNTCSINNYFDENIFFLIIKNNMIKSFRFLVQPQFVEYIKKYINLEYFELYPIHEACMNMNIEILDFLIKNGSIINTYNTRLTPLHLCCLFRFYDGIYLLINNGADIHAIEKNNNQNILHILCRETISCQYYDYEQDNYLINYLLENNINENLLDKHYLTAYNYAYIYGIEDKLWFEKCNIFINRKIKILENNVKNIDVNLFKNIISFIYKKIDQ
jgi:ankyrin repeat protein